ncbi:uncharacterized protein LOC108665869 [Hyalella azteca]|uniref:Uncharacterized protein LOC108665869 n=1 Tax=Hyalella azteca TaxID=294128 RepID=A0A8B7N2V5_HYAAZ|nr:uncharacterized protein LOC108665869 [Hyalella azteca]
MSSLVPFLLVIALTDLILGEKEDSQLHELSASRGVFPGEKEYPDVKHGEAREGTSLTDATTPSTTTINPTTTMSSLIEIINTGTIPLVSSGKGTCRVISNDYYTYILSPRYPSPHPPSSYCYITFNTTEPRFLRFLPVTPNFGWFDYMAISGVYKDKRSINGQSTSQEIIFPSTRVTFEYSAFWLFDQNPFYIYMEAKNNDCQQLIKLRDGASGELYLPTSFPTSPYCQWWIRAPAGRRVFFDVLEFSSGSSDCSRSYALVNYGGLDFNGPSTTRLCGQSVTSALSEGNEMNVLVKATVGSLTTFRAIYSLI